VSLTAKHQGELEEDVADMVWSIFGSAVHSILEHGKDDNHIVEQRLHAQVNGWNISGAVDLQIDSEAGTQIRDYKTTSAWAVMNEKAEWEQQLNIYAWLVEIVRNVKVIDLGIVAIIRDWSRRDALTRDSYPEAPIKELPIKLWTMDERMAFISDRIELHSACDFALETGDDLPPCTPSEMWEKPAVYAVRKKGGVRAKSLHSTQEEADEALAALGKDYELDLRPGERTRCANFCPVNQWCDQWRTFQTK
jgi:hypothetical protein